MKEVELLKEENIDSYIDFIRQVFDYECKKEDVKKLIKKHKILIIKNQTKVIASLVLEKQYDYIKAENYYHVGYVGVLKEYRRMGYANILFDKVDAMAKEDDIKYLELTSGNHRKAAHYLYQSRGFKIKDTMVFVKIY